MNDVTCFKNISLYFHIQYREELFAVEGTEKQARATFIQESQRWLDLILILYIKSQHLWFLDLQ